MPPVALFDLDNTLLDREAAYERWAREFCEARGLTDGAVAYLVEADEDGFRPREDLFAEARRRFALTDPVDVLVDGYHTAYPRAFDFPDESRSALRRLRGAGWKVGIVTNGHLFQHRKVEATGLADEVDTVCVSHSLDSWKPDPFIFEEAARRCGAELHGWMVGDNGPADIRGGQGVGLRTIWIHRGREWDLGDPAPDAQVATVAEAVGVILGDGPRG